jgi:hypothetical protein
VLGVLGYKPREFASQMNLKPTIRLYQVPADTFEEDEDAGHEMGIDEQDE